jgi:predicted ATPase
MNATLVAAICVRLDGLPLAIELAAARTKLLPLRDLLARLDQRLSFLTVAYSDRLPHQQTLRGALDWSYRLLPAIAQRLLTRLAVFAGSWSLAAAEAICADTHAQDPPLTRAQLLESLMTLIDHSLVQANTGDGETRYSLLETVRIYALDHLIAGGERHILEARHAAYYAGVAERSAAGGASRADLMASLDEERDNLACALAWALQHDPNRARALRALVVCAPRLAAPLAHLPLVGGAA